MPTISGGGDPCTGCTNETYEGTGTSVAGWVYGGGAGTVTNVDYTTAPAPIIGSQSFLIRNVAFDSAYAYLVIPSSGEVWMRWTMIVTNTIVNNTRVALAAASGFVIQASVEIQSSSLRIVYGTANATTVSDLVAGTQYYCWMHIDPVGAGSGVADIAFSTSKTRPTSGNDFAQVTTGSLALDIVNVGPSTADIGFSGAISGIIYENFSISTTGQIGDFP